MSQLSTGLSDDERKQTAGGKKKPRRSPFSIPASEDLDALMNTHQVRVLMGGITNVSLSRWIGEGKFPVPDCVVGNRYFWQRRTVVAVIERLKASAAEDFAAAKKKQAATKPHLAAHSSNASDPGSITPQAKNAPRTAVGGARLAPNHSSTAKPAESASSPAAKLAGGNRGATR